MQPSDLLLPQVRRALTATFLLGGVASLPQLALPLCALPTADSAVPSRSFETLGLMASLGLGTPSHRFGALARLPGTPPAQAHEPGQG